MNQLVLAEVAKRGFGEIDFTPMHGIPELKEIVPGIRRNGVLLEMRNCVGCGVPVSYSPAEKVAKMPPLCTYCVDRGFDGDGEDDEELRR